MLEKQFEELKLTGNLPSPTGVGLLILQTTQREDASLDDVVAVLQADPTLTGRILKLANSGNATGYEPASTAKEAAVRLGLATVRNVSLSFSLLAGNRTGRCRAFDYEEYWSHSLAVAVAAKLLAEGRSDVEPSEAFTCSLLSGIGRLALASIHPEAYEGVLARALGQSSRRLAELEQESFGTHHRELAAAMLRDWKLPSRFAVAAGMGGGSSSTDDLTDRATRALAVTLHHARDLARSLTLPVDASAETCRKRHGELARMSKRLGMDPAGLDSLWQAVCEEWRVWGDLMRIRGQAALGLADIRARAEGPDEASVTESEPDVSDGLVATSEEAPGERRGLRIQLVGLEESTRRELEQLLESDGHQVSSVSDGQEGLAMALETGPQLVVSEWDVPGLDGLSLARTLRQSEIGKRMHLVLLTDHDKQERVLEAFEAGVDEHLAKPFDARILQARVRAAQRVVRLSEKVQGLLRERESQLSQLAIQKRNLRMIAISDPLTGLFNRRFAMERMQDEIEVSNNSAKPLSVIMIDIDHFKRVNDEFGHDAGDVVLSASAALMRQGVRRKDSPCRVGGEEFLLLLPGADLEAACNVAERLRCKAEETVIEHGEFRRPVTYSLGVATLRAGESEPDLLLKRADRCVYLAKERGRNRVVTESALGDLRKVG